LSIRRKTVQDILTAITAVAAMVAAVAAAFTVKVYIRQAKAAEENNRLTEQLVEQAKDSNRIARERAASVESQEAVTRTVQSRATETARVQTLHLIGEARSEFRALRAPADGTVGIGSIAQSLQIKVDSALREIASLPDDRRFAAQNAVKEFGRHVAGHHQPRFVEAQFDLLEVAVNQRLVGTTNGSS
jgi:hypothetical protein